MPRFCQKYGKQNPMNLNVLLEFSTITNGPEADKVLDIIENRCKSNELFLVGWTRKGKKIRILSKFSDILSAIDTKQFTPAQLEIIQYKKIDT